MGNDSGKFDLEAPEEHGKQFICYTTIKVVRHYLPTPLRDEDLNQVHAFPRGVGVGNSTLIYICKLRQSNVF